MKARAVVRGAVAVPSSPPASTPLSPLQGPAQDKLRAEPSPSSSCGSRARSWVHLRQEDSKHKKPRHMGTKIRPISVITGRLRLEGQEFKACLVYMMSPKPRAPQAEEPYSCTQLAGKLQGLFLWEKVLAQDWSGTADHTHAGMIVCPTMPYLSSHCLY